MLSLGGGIAGLRPNSGAGAGRKNPKLAAMRAKISSHNVLGGDGNEGK